MWQKYKIGQSLSILDPETKAPAVKNPFLQPKPGVLIKDDIAIDRLLADGAVIGACDIALKFFSGQLAGNVGVSAEEAAKEWAAHVIPWDHTAPIRDVGPQPSPGAWLHLLRGGLIRAAADISRRRGALPPAR